MGEFNREIGATNGANQNIFIRNHHGDDMYEITQTASKTMVIPEQT